jgi:alpha-beta hydrolase superfamily lysophospholipase
MALSDSNCPAFARDRGPAKDGTPLAFLDCAPIAPTDVIVHVHGLESHNGWLYQLASGCADRGIGFSGLDRRGSGDSGGPPGDAPSNQVLLDDIDLGVKRARRKWPRARLHLLGLCLGARLAVLYAAQHWRKLASLILVSPSFHLSPHAQLPLRQRLSLACDALVRPLRLWPSPLRDWMFSDNPEVQEFLASDPRKLTAATSRFLFNLFARVRTRDLLANLGGLPIPVTVACAGERDRVLDTTRIRQEINQLIAVNRRIRLAVFPVSGHLIYFDALSQFLDDAVEHIAGVDGYGLT